MREWNGKEGMRYPQYNFPAQKGTTVNCEEGSHDFRETTAVGLIRCIRCGQDYDFAR